ncbi:GNAT family N-acetyltransferase [Leucobacter sp. UT-8R-CII-1-4]|uniref:GNAT family N-acetyltransferase n=1 Tax=Leucobacter sp. UT-8R-CII-1-4 TaxID=3040075 RepID=UPI0024A87F9C|nr:GNAT family N-acetyltransferase [Leucobacter sp. UT-8R-CII-1-4]MDI6024358.1 GNAT family N-acetyltransferase [Leucobacter sp. UT-8R-CII-1-4]
MPENSHVGMPDASAHSPIAHWRSAALSDVPDIYALITAAASVDSPKDSTTLEEVDLALRSSNFSESRFRLETDTALGFGQDGSLIAFATVKLAEPGEREVEASLDGTVHPAWRGKGVGRSLLAWQEKRARELLRTDQSGLPGMIHLGARETCADHLALYRAAGFHPERWWMDLRRPLGDLPALRSLPEGMMMSEFKAGYSERVRKAINDAFRDHWSTQAISPEQWESEGNLAAFSASCSRVVLAKTGRWPRKKRVVAALLSEIRPEDWALHGESFGYISAIGVVRDARGQGLSSALIIEALHAFSNRHLDSAMLSVDSVNPSGALAMYERLGFKLVDRSVSYVKYC